MVNDKSRYLVLSIYAILLIIALAGCSPEASEKSDLTFEDYESDFKDWADKRNNALVSPDGWLSLAGLYWLDPGPNTFGSDSSNNLIFPKEFPGYAGIYIQQEDTIQLQLDENAGIKVEDKPVTKLKITDSNNPTLQYNSFTWYVIKRGDKVAIRLKDTLNYARLNFNGIERYPLDMKWRLKAEFIPNPANSIIPVENIMGYTSNYPNPGKLKFEVEGMEYTLELVDDGTEGKYFLIFADETSGKTTYGGGRYMYPDKPGASNEIILDFNKAYNPPCVFTDYATCPLPPKGNYLPVAISAGEKNYNH